MIAKTKSNSTLDSTYDRSALDEDHCSRPCLNYFEEKDAFMSTIESNLAKEATSAYDYDTLIINYEPAIKILNKYMAQPQLLDAHLPSILAPIFTYIRSNIFGAENLDSKGAVFYVVYHVILVRRPKLFLKYFPHEASDVEKLLQLLCHSQLQAYKYWHARYVLLLWLSYLMMLPFNIRFLLKSSEQESVVDRILNIGKPYLSSPGKERETSAMLIGRTLSRVDVMPEYLPKFTSWMSSKPPGTQSIFALTGLLQALCNVLKFSDRKLILPFVSIILPFLNWLDLPVISRSNVLRKLMMKCAQRIGMVLLKQKPPSWRYQRGSRTLSLSSVINKNKMNEIMTHGAPQVNEDFENDDVPEEIETLVNILFTGLKDSDTIVRWSASKGFGRIAYRLPKEMAEEIMFSIFQLLQENGVFDPKRGYLASACESTWHGACLTIAEFTRRGILLPSHLPSVIHWIEMGLTLDLRKGNSSVGSNVRDAACFVCWSIARGYSPEVVKPFVHRLAPLLVSVAVFDREVNVRRAASAAFQENVGRQGVYPHGIDIVTATDFFIIGNRQTSFLEAAPHVAKFPEYHPYLLKYLLRRLLQHWDESIRQLAAKSCRILITDCPTSFQIAFDELQPLLLDSDLPTRHGALLGLAESMIAAFSFVKTAHLEAIWNTIMSIEHHYLHSFGSEHTRNGLCRIIECISRVAHFGQLPKAWVSGFFNLLESSWERKEENLQEDAAQAAGFLIKHLSPGDAEILVKKWCDTLCQVTTPLLTRIGIVRVLGTTAHISIESLKMSLTALINVMSFPKVHTDATLKKCVMASLGDLVDESLGSEYVSNVLKSLQIGLDDYTTSAQGDIGSWVRIAAMKAILAKASHIYWSNYQIASFHLFSKCLHQCVSRIDKVRSVAQHCVKELLSYFKHLPEYSFLLATFTSQEDWSYSLVAFQSLAPLLQFDPYRDSILSGFIFCIGASSASTERDATEVLLSYIEENQSNPLLINNLAESLYNIYKQSVKGIERNFVSFFSALHLLYCGQTFSIEMTLVHQQFFEITSNALLHQSSIPKTLLLLKSCCCFMSIPSTRQQAIQLAIEYLAHEVPRIRKAAAEQILIFLPLYFYCAPRDTTLSVEYKDHLYTQLIETDWTLSSLESLQETYKKFKHSLLLHS